ncbi:MAG: DUF374 domain-containing protein [Deltaproteobacteria bacterium]|nr:DUF374 domain-containing protein [Deltaproteobacteria bacterium]
MTEIFKKFKKKLTHFLIPIAGPLVIRFLYHSMRFTRVNFEGYRSHLKSGGKIILALWHGRLLLMPYAYEGQGITALMSKSQDGSFLSEVLSGFGVKSVRGSSSRGWLGGIKGLLKAAKSGQDLTIAPDGPKGPRYKAQAGVIMLARTTGLPIIPMTFSSEKKKLLVPGITS